MRHGSFPLPYTARPREVPAAAASSLVEQASTIPAVRNPGRPRPSKDRADNRIRAVDRVQGLSLIRGTRFRPVRCWGGTAERLRRSTWRSTTALDDRTTDLLTVDEDRTARRSANDDPPS
jgi:hypothetical protein